MQTVSLKTRADNRGVLKLEIPTDLRNQEVEVVIVMHPVETEAVDEMGYPIGYFEETYDLFADDPLERNQPLEPDIRDALA